MRWLVGLLMLAASPAVAVTCEDIDHRGTSFTVCDVAATEDLQLFLRNANGEILGSFNAVERDQSRNLLFAMNAGMYHENRAPVGHYIEDGVQEMRVIPNAGPGNFGLLPNGVFCIADTLRVYETLDYQAREPNCTHATQSGPMLVINGALHHKFIEGGTSKHVRNGVGTTADGSRAVFAISNEPVNFYDFGTLFRDRLSLPNALFFDGNISRMYDRASGRSDFGWQLGPIVGVLE